MATSNVAPYKYLQFKGDQYFCRYIQEDIPAKSPSAKSQEQGLLQQIATLDTAINKKEQERAITWRILFNKLGDRSNYYEKVVLHHMNLQMRRLDAPEKGFEG